MMLCFICVSSWICAIRRLDSINYGLDSPLKRWEHLHTVVEIVIVMSIAILVTIIMAVIAISVAFRNGNSNTMAIIM